MRRIADHLEEGACVLVFAVMTVVAFVNVVTRYLIRYSLAFTEEIVVSLFVWLTLLGAAIAFREGSHMGFTFLVERAPLALRRALCWLSVALSVALFGALAWFGVLQIQSERQLATTSEALAIPQWWYTAGIPLLSLLVIARVIQAAVAADRRGRAGGRA